MQILEKHCSKVHTQFFPPEHLNVTVHTYPYYTLTVNAYEEQVREEVYELKRHLHSLGNPLMKELLNAGPQVKEIREKLYCEVYLIRHTNHQKQIYQSHILYNETLREGLKWKQVKAKAQVEQPQK